MSEHSEADTRNRTPACLHAPRVEVSSEHQPDSPRLFKRRVRVTPRNLSIGANTIKPHARFCNNKNYDREGGRCSHVRAFQSGYDAGEITHCGRPVSTMQHSNFDLRALRNGLLPCAAASQNNSPTHECVPILGSFRGRYETG